MTTRVLVVEDEPAIRDVVAYALRGEGHEVVEAGDGELGLRLAVEQPFDVAILDVMLPGLSGTELCRRLRSLEVGDLPVLMLSARGAEVDRVLGLDAGADDYLTKPFSTAELLARVRSLLRRRELDSGPGPVLRVGPLTLDLERNEASHEGRVVALTPGEARLLAVLAATPGRPVPREALVRALWSSDYLGDRRACDTHVKNLRRKLERDPARPQLLRTVRGVGYLLDTL